jgi:hypothetical protein
MPNSHILNVEIRKLLPKSNIQLFQLCSGINHGKISERAMKLHQFETDKINEKQARDALRHLVDHPIPPAIRPCMSCDRPCPCCGSLTCGCACTVDCEHAPQKLSSDPTNFVIEAGIYPLVFAFSCLGTCPPFWSCEGHLDQFGRLSRIPRVWFYVQDLSYPRLIQSHLTQLAAKKRLNNIWHVCLTHSDSDNIDTAFSLEPYGAINDVMKLDELRQDILAIAEDFIPAIKDLADQLIVTTS